MNLAEQWSSPQLCLQGKESRPTHLWLSMPREGSVFQTPTSKVICCLSLLSVSESEHLLFSWFTLASKPCIISLIPWPPDNHWQWVPWVNRWLCSFGRADLSLFPFSLQTTSLTFLPGMEKGQRLPSNGLWYFMCFQDYSCGWEAPLRTVLCWAWSPWESKMMSIGGMLEYFILPERKQK